MKYEGTKSAMSLILITIFQNKQPWMENQTSKLSLPYCW